MKTIQDGHYALSVYNVISECRQQDKDYVFAKSHLER
jgi:hypothetical protein